MDSHVTWSNCEYGLAGSLSHENDKIMDLTEYLSYNFLSICMHGATMVFSKYNELVPGIFALSTSYFSGYYFLKAKKKFSINSSNYMIAYFYIIFIFYIAYNSNYIQTCLNIILYIIGYFASKQELKI